MISRREKLVESLLTAYGQDQSPESLDTVLRLILGDMGQFFLEFHRTDGPGVMVFQPESSESSMFYMPVGALHEWREDYVDGAKDIQRIIDACLKINPLEQACYLILDSKGFRFLILDYNQTADQETLTETD